MPRVPRIQSVIPGLLVSVWRVEEDESFFLNRLTLHKGEMAKLNSFKHPERRILWLASRYCLKDMLGIESEHVHVESLNTDSGKPFLSDNSFHISFSHSHKYAAAVASHTGAVAIDLEDPAKPRNLEVAKRFMNAQELAAWQSIRTKELFLSIFSAKESIIKIVGKGTSMRDDIHISFDKYDGKPNGSFHGTVQKGDIVQHYEVHYHIRSGFVLTYCNSVLPADISGEFLSSPHPAF
jgi:phosphopantetheine--protein transferase-like protein